MMLEQTDTFRCDPNHPDAQDLMRRFSAHQLKFTRGNPLRPFVWNGMCENFGQFLVAWNGKEPVACGALVPITRQIAELRRIYAEPGYGKIMIDALQYAAQEEAFSRLVLATRKENTRSIRFYRRNGFVVSDGYWPYQDDEDAVCFERAVKQWGIGAPEFASHERAEIMAV